VDKIRAGVETAINYSQPKIHGRL